MASNVREIASGGVENQDFLGMTSPNADLVYFGV